MLGNCFHQVPTKVVRARKSSKIRFPGIRQQHKCVLPSFERWLRKKLHMPCPKYTICMLEDFGIETETIPEEVMHLCSKEEYLLGFTVDSGASANCMGQVWADNYRKTLPPDMLKKRTSPRSIKVSLRKWFSSYS